MLPIKSWAAVCMSRRSEKERSIPPHSSAQGTPKGTEPNPEPASRLRRRLVELRRLLQLCERERGLIANELHDGAVQELVAAHMFLESALEATGRRSAARPLLEQALQRVDAALSELRAVMTRARLPAFQGDGLREAIQRLTEAPRFQGLSIDLQLNLQRRHFLPTVELAVYRIVQEALQNVLRHSGTNRASVRIEDKQGVLRVEIEDKGRGFRRQEVGKGHFGLISMRQRAQLMGGSLKVISKPGAGTRVLASIPIRDTLLEA